MHSIGNHKGFNVYISASSKSSDQESPSVPVFPHPESLHPESSQILSLDIPILNYFGYSFEEMFINKYTFQWIFFYKNLDTSKRSYFSCLLFIFIEFVHNCTTCFRFPLIRTTTVSYTHLDVYKRQVQQTGVSIPVQSN